MKVFFNNITMPGPDMPATESITLLLLNNDLVALNSKDSVTYDIYIQPDIQKLAQDFGVHIQNMPVEGIEKAAEKAKEFIRQIREDLLNEVMKYMKEKTAFLNFDISFMGSYENIAEVNAMIEAICLLTKTTTFEKFSKVCKNTAIDLAWLNLENKIPELEYKLNRCSRVDNMDVILKTIDMNRRLIHTISSSSCFNREFFAMLFVKLDDYVKKEKAIEKIINFKNNQKPLNWVRIND